MIQKIEESLPPWMFGAGGRFVATLVAFGVGGGLIYAQITSAMSEVRALTELQRVRLEASISAARLETDALRKEADATFQAIRNESNAAISALRNEAASLRRETDAKFDATNARAINIEQQVIRELNALNTTVGRLAERLDRIRDDHQSSRNGGPE